MLRLRCCALFLLQLVSFFLFAQSVTAKSATGSRVLVIHEEDAVRTTFSQFFDSLQSNFPSIQDSECGPAREYQLTFLNPKKDPSATLTKYEERLYDHIVLFPQKLKGNNHSSCSANVSRNLQW